MAKEPKFPLKIFYDGGCRVCDAEMRQYRRKDHGGRLEFVDITDDQFEPGQYEIDEADFMEQMHAIDSRGEVFRGVDAFRAIWLAFPRSTFFGLLARLITLPGIHALAQLGYRIFARYRKYLPRKKSCSGDRCDHS